MLQQKYLFSILFTILFQMHLDTAYFEQTELSRSMNLLRTVSCTETRGLSLFVRVACKIILSPKNDVKVAIC